MALARSAFRAFCVLVALAVISTVPRAAAEYCTTEEAIDLCYQSGRGVPYPCQCMWDDGMSIYLDGPDIDRPDRPPNRPDNSLPGGGSGRPGGGGGGGPIIGGGGGRGGGGRR